MVAQQKKFVLMVLPIRTESSAQLIPSLLPMAVQSYVMISKEKSCAHQWKTQTDARTQPSVCKEPLIPMDNTVQLIPSAQLIAKMTRLLVLMELTPEAAKRPLFAELKEQTRMENFALVCAHQLVQLMKS